jgi:2-octaprenyl-6-methoxyphenol hydroxylase
VAVRLSAAEQGVPLLGAVVAYGRLVGALQNAWFAAVERAPDRLASRFGAEVAALKDASGGVEVDAGTADCHDLVVVAEGGVFATQARKALTHDYRQRAWVGTVVREGQGPGTAFERFTRQGPLALLPLRGAERATSDDARYSADRHPMALVWCTPAGDDPVPTLDDRQRLAVLNSLLPVAAGRLVEIGPLKGFDLGLNAEGSLVRGRQVRIGNAAQTLHPVAGQGLNLGLRDALTLVQALQRTEDIDAALRRVEWARAPDRWALIATTDFLARSFTWRAPGVAAARGLALAALQSLPPLKRALAHHMMFGRR